MDGKQFSGIPQSRNPISVLPGPSHTNIIRNKTGVDIIEDDFEVDEEVEMMLQHHDDPTINILYMETRRRSTDPSSGGSVDDVTLTGSMLILDNMEDADELQPIAPRSDSADSPIEDWDMMLGVDEEIRESQQEMASGFRSLIGIDAAGVKKLPGVPNDWPGTDTPGSDVEMDISLNDELTTIQTTTPVYSVFFYHICV